MHTWYTFLVEDQHPQHSFILATHRTPVQHQRLALVGGAAGLVGHLSGESAR